MATRLLVVLGLALALVLGGCTWSSEEPGLFRTPSPSPVRAPVPAPSVSDSAPSDPGPQESVPLPVAGERVWTTGEGADLTLRFAVHAVRRIPGATVLDWSVTPLAAPGLVAGDPLPGTTELAVTRSAGPGIGTWLLDPRTRRAYRNLTHSSSRTLHHCLCAPLWAVQPELRIGTTRLLQTAFPPLPARVSFLDVQLANVAPVVHVPVTPVGLVPTARREVDLTRPAAEPAPAARPVRFRHPAPQSGRVSAVTVDRVVASPGGTTVVWTLRSLDDSSPVRRQPPGPPVSGPLPVRLDVATPNPTDGPTLRPAGSRDAPLRTRWLSGRGPGRPVYECLCSDLGLWSRALEERGGEVHLAGLYPALPPGTRSVEVSLPGVAVIRAPVSRASDAARRLGPPVRHSGSTWGYAEAGPPQGWPVSAWPTPLPDEWELPDYQAVVDAVGPLPRER